MSGQQSNNQQLKSSTAMKFAVTYGQTQLALLLKYSHLSVITTTYFVATFLFCSLQFKISTTTVVSTSLWYTSATEHVINQRVLLTPPPPPLPRYRPVHFVVSLCTFIEVRIYCGFSCVQLHSWSSLYNDNDFPALNLEVSDVMIIHPSFSTSTFTLSC